MGIFDSFKGEKKKFSTTLHGLNLREWDDGYKRDEKSLINITICIYRITPN